MLQQKPSYKRISAVVILLVFLASWSFGSLHQLLRHHDHNGYECSANYDKGNVSHLHDARYAKDICSLCAFVLSTPALLSISSLLSGTKAIPGTKDSFQCKFSVAGKIHDTSCLRGPPAL